MSTIPRSAVPLETGYVNPFFSKVGFLVGNVSGVRSLVSAIQECAHELGDRRGGDFDALKNLVLSKGLEQQARKLYDEFHGVSESPPVIGPPPSSGEVYGRFMKGAQVTDIGTGNGAKVTPYTGTIRFTVVDKDLDVSKKLVAKKVNANVDLYDFEEDEVVSSFMTLCQLNQQQRDKIAQQDGVHLIPDHQALLSSGAAILYDNCVQVKTPLGDYFDFPLEAVGFVPEVGYRTIATYRPRDIQIMLTSQTQTQEYRPVSECSPIGFMDVDLNDMGFKFDGIFLELEVCQGLAYLVDRSGQQAVGTTSFQHHMVLHLECMGQSYVLLRVVHYRTFAPPHSGDMLRLFASRVNVNINGRPVLGPPEWRPGTPTGPVTFKTDGLITRKDGRDYYVKHQWTADLLPTAKTRLQKRLERDGLRLQFDPREGLWEYGIDRDKDLVILVPKFERTDKRQATSIDTVAYMLSLPTLPEMYVLE